MIYFNYLLNDLFLVYYVKLKFQVLFFLYHSAKVCAIFINSKLCVRFGLKKYFHAVFPIVRYQNVTLSRRVS